MDTISGKNFQGVLEGGAADSGRYVWMTWVVGGERQTVLVEQSKVGPFIAAISTSAGMAADERLRQGLMEPNTAYALDVVSAEPARSDTQAGTAILDLTVDASRSKPWHLYLAADRSTLEGMRAAIDRAIQMLGEKRRAN